MNAAPDFASRLERWTIRTALIAEDGTSVSYADLAARADAFASSLPASVRLLAIDAQREIDVIAAYLGALRRRIPVLMYEAGEKSAAMLSCFRPDATYARTAGSGDFELRETSRVALPAPHSDLALLLSTSGSTGSSKLVRLSADNLSSNAASIAEYLGVTPDDVTISSLPLNYSFGLSVVHSYLHAGATIVVSDAGLGERRFVDLASRHRLTSLSGVPSSYELLERAGTLGKLPATVKTLTQAGGRLAPDAVLRMAAFAEARNARFFVMYGQTEATARIAYLPPEKLRARPDCIGRAMPGGLLTIENEQGPVEPGQTGQLVYSGPNVMMGYATSRDDLARGSEIGSLETGDLGVEVEPGLFRIVGRVSRFVKPLGLRIGLDDLEYRIRTHGVSAFVTGDDSGIVIAVADQPGLDIAKTVLDAMSLPGSITEYVLRAPPLLANGKIDYRTILADARARGRSALSQATGVNAVRAAFSDAAGGMPFDNSTCFDDLAGDSLSYINTAIVVEDALGAIPPNWPSLTLGELQVLAAKPAEPSRWQSVDIDLLLRALAIVIVVTNHALGGLQGGADLLLLLAGYNWARFQRKRLLQGHYFSVLWRSMGKIAAIFVAIVVLYSVYKQTFYWKHLLLISTFSHDWGGLLNIYWFIQCLIWCALLVVALYAVPPIRQFAIRAPVAAALFVFALAYVIRFVGGTLDPAMANVMRTPDQLFVYFAGGWLMAITGQRVRLAVSLALAATSLMAWGAGNPHWMIMASGCLLLSLVGAAKLPGALAVSVRTIGKHSFYIYILSALPMYLTDIYLGEPTGRFWLLHIGLAFALGIGAGTALDRLPNFQLLPTSRFRRAHAV